ncbi:MAG TPA: hypothetical protein VK817_14910 [Trebonia sp.]|jgi:hypothetical protein|nr:hypothetical protein [Trebonia sp.]
MTAKKRLILGFDAVFLADVVGAYDVFRGSATTSIRQGLQIPNNDPATRYHGGAHLPEGLVSA